MCYPYSENKGGDQLCSTAVTAQLISVFVFAYAYAEIRFSDAAAHLYLRGVLLKVVKSGIPHNKFRKAEHFIVSCTYKFRITVLKSLEVLY